MGIGLRIKTAMEAANKLPVDIAKHLDITESAVSQWFTKDSGPKSARYAHLAAFLGTSVEWLTSDAATPPRPPASQIVAEAPRTGPADIPVWASAQAGDDGAIILVPDPIDYIRRSERMQFVKSPFAFNVLGDSMSPAIEHGDQVVVNPSVVAAPGNDCVFIHEGPDGMLALIKRLLRPRTAGWYVRQFNPAKDFEIPRAKWHRVHAIAEVRKRGVG